MPAKRNYHASHHRNSSSTNEMRAIICRTPCGTSCFTPCGTPTWWSLGVTDPSLKKCSRNVLHDTVSRCKRSLVQIKCNTSFFFHDARLRVKLRDDTQNKREHLKI